MNTDTRRRGRGRPRSDEGSHDSRRALLEAAAQLIAEHGYHATAVDDVVRAAGVAKGTFYWHFKSKDDLLFTVLDERFDRPVRDLIELLESAPPEHDIAPEATDRLLTRLQQQPETVVLEQEYRLLALRDPELRAKYTKRQAELRRALARGLDARAARLGAPRFSTPTEHIATAFLGLTSGLGLEKLIDPGGVPDDLVGETFALVYLGLVTKASTTSGASDGPAGPTGGRAPFELSGEPSPNA